MKLWPIAGSALFAWGAAALGTGTGETYAILIAGDLHGYLSPCGCTKPMSGGIRRLASAVRSFASKDGTVFLFNGPIAGPVGRQGELKLETVAESLRAMDVSAANLSSSDAALGRGALQSAIQLSEDRFISTGLQESAANSLPPYALKGPFLVGGIAAAPEVLARTLGERPRSQEASAAWLNQQSADGGFLPILMIERGRDEAAELAKRNPSLVLVAYRSTGIPRMEKVGKTVLVTPGEKGKHVVRLLYRDGEISGYVPISLGPEHKDDPTVSRLYRNYLTRVGDEKLLEAMPRRSTEGFVGTTKCGSCHAPALRVWKASAHAHALRTLEKDGHGVDPDCVGCHVVALGSTAGYRSRKATPSLADVGCESCHGPGRLHAARPKVARMPKVGSQPCLNCHTGNTSPGFSYPTHWKMIAH